MLGLRILITLLFLAGSGATRAEAIEEPEAELKHPAHAWLLQARFTPQLAWIDGTIKATGKGQSTSVSLQDDVGLDDPETDLGGSLSMRLGRHDFVLSAFNFVTATRTIVSKEFEFDGIVIPITREARTKIEYLNVDLQYGYSFFDLEKHGFRLGPTVSLGYFRFKAKIEDVATGRSGDIEEELPLPTVGLSGEIPWRRFLLQANVSGIYINASTFEGAGARVNTSLTWRLFKYVGVVGGYGYIFADVDAGRDNYEIEIQGAYVGVEFRY